MQDRFIVVCSLRGCGSVFFRTKYERGPFEMSGRGALTSKKLMTILCLKSP